MGMIGNPIQFGNLPAYTATGDGTTVNYVLTWLAGTPNGLDVNVGGVRQVPTLDYTVSGFILTFVTAPPSGVAILIVGQTVAIAGVPADASVTAVKMAPLAETSLVSADTVSLGVTASFDVLITGSTTITSFGTAPAGTKRSVRMSGAVTLTHNATSLICAGAANITTSAGDCFEANSLGSGNWVITRYQKADGTPLVVVPGVPTGAVMPFAGATAPSGWLLSYGQAISRTTYAALFAAVGTVHGVGDGSTTFNLPDMRGRVMAGKDDMGGSAASRMTAGGSGITGTTLGAVGGTQTHTLTVAELASHSHTNQAPWGNGGELGGGYVYPLSAGSGSLIPATNNTGSNTAHNNTQPTLICNYIIKT